MSRIPKTPAFEKSTHSFFFRFFSPSSVCMILSGSYVLVVADLEDLR